MPDYAVSRISSRTASTGVAGLAGTLAVFGLAAGVGLLVRKSANRGER